MKLSQRVEIRRDVPCVGGAYSDVGHGGLGVDDRRVLNPMNQVLRSSWQHSTDEGAITDVRESRTKAGTAAADAGAPVAGGAAIAFDVRSPFVRVAPGQCSGHLLVLS